MGKTSSEVKARWNAANYTRFSLYLRTHDDKDYIQFIEEQRNAGATLADIVREGIDAIKEKK